MHDRISVPIGVSRERRNVEHVRRLAAGVASAVTVALVLVGCGGSNRSTADTGSAAPATGGASATAPNARGKTVQIQMLGDAQGYRFSPTSVTIRPGDVVVWTNVSGGPHNVTFWPDSIPPGASQLLQANMPRTTGPLTSPLFTAPNEPYSVSFAGASPGTYRYYCVPHMALGMKAQLIVQP